MESMDCRVQGKPTWLGIERTDESDTITAKNVPGIDFCICAVRWILSFSLFQGLKKERATGLMLQHHPGPSKQ